MFGERLKAVRNARKETQRDMAERLGVTVRTIANWEAGDRTPTIEMLSQIASTYSVTTDYLLGMDSAKKPDLPFPETIAAHTDGPMTPELQAEIEAIARKVMEKYLKDKH